MTFLSKHCVCISPLLSSPPGGGFPYLACGPVCGWWSLISEYAGSGVHQLAKVAVCHLCFSPESVTVILHASAQGFVIVACKQHHFCPSYLRRWGEVGYCPEWRNAVFFEALQENWSDVHVLLYPSGLEPQDGLSFIHRFETLLFDKALMKCIILFWIMEHWFTVNEGRQHL